MERSTDNIKVLRNYSDWLINKSPYAKSTSEIQLSHISKFEEFIEWVDFRSLDDESVLKYRNYLKIIRHNGKPLVLKTIQERLKSVQRFFSWLKKQPGYKIKIKDSLIDCFELKKSEKNTINTQRNLREFPSLSEIKKLICSIKDDNEVDKRDCGIIAFLIMTGIRVGSLIRLRIRHVDSKRLIVTLNPEDGVPTKFGKAFKVSLMVWDKFFLDQFSDWLKFLVDVKKYGPDAPLFPKTDIKVNAIDIRFYATDVAPEFWASTGQVNQLLKRRAKQAGLKYYNPHSYRSTIYKELRKFNPTTEQAAAVSQNLGHSTIHITETYYGYMQPDDRLDIITDLFSRMGNSTLEKRIDAMEKKFDQSFNEILKRLSKHDTLDEKDNTLKEHKRKDK